MADETLKLDENSRNVNGAVNSSGEIRNLFVDDTGSLLVTGGAVSVDYDLILVDD